MAQEDLLLPTVNRETEPFWEACRRHELLLKRCRECGRFHYYPRAICPHCLSLETEWVKAIGRGRVYTFTVTYQNRHWAFKDKTPYVLAYVELEEGVRMMTNIVQCRPEEVHIGMPVEVVFEDLADRIALPKFKPSS